MVVMLIMSIILAAMAPVMTTRSKADSSSPWRYSPENLSDAFFGAGESQVAMIGQPNKLETDDPARLIINSSASLPVHLSFKRGDTILGRLQFSDTNVLLGSGNFDHINGGSNNISIGPNNLTQLTSGSSNVVVGDNAMIANTTGSNNTALGTSLTANTTGSRNTALGDNSLLGNTTHSNNTSVGYNALMSADNEWNVAVGSNAYQNGTGGSNTIIGGDSMSQGSGSNNVAVGTNALWYGTGDGNVAIGANANYENNVLTTFTNTTAVGFSSFAGNNGTAIGHEAYADSGCTAIGDQAQANNSAIAIGKESNANQTISTAIGYSADAKGPASIAIGPNSLADNGASIALGQNAASEGGSSAALGNYSTASGRTSIAIGSFAEASNTDTIAIGNSVISSGESSIAIGSNEITHTTQALADKAIAIGDGAYATGENSIALGSRAEARGLDNTAIGTQACEGVTGSNKTCIGAHSGPLSPAQRSDRSTESLYFGTAGHFRSGSTSVDTNGILELHKKGDYAVAFLNADLVVNGFTWTQVGGKSGHGDAIGFFRSKTWKNQVELYNERLPSFPPASPFSDRRLKYVGNENTSGLDKIKQLKVFNYTFKKDEKKTPHVGVIAQDLQKVFPDAVKKGADGFLSIRFEDMFFAVINAIKELDSRVTVLEKENKELKNQIKEQNSRLKVLETKLNKIYTEN